MKNIFCTALLLFGIAFGAYADEGRGSCIISGTDNDYVEVTAYSDGKGSGNFVIANSSSKPLMSVYVTITAEVAKTNVYETKILYQGNYTGKVESYSSKNVDFTYSGSYNKIRNISVTVNNPTCK